MVLHTAVCVREDAGLKGGHPGHQELVVGTRRAGSVHSVAALGRVINIERVSVRPDTSVVFVITSDLIVSACAVEAMWEWCQVVAPHAS